MQKTRRQNECMGKIQNFYSRHKSAKRRMIICMSLLFHFVLVQKKKKLNLTYSSYSFGFDLLEVQ